MGKKEVATNDSETNFLPSEGIRTVVSFLLIVHFSAIAIGWLSNNSLGRSQLVASAADRFFRPYLQTLWLEKSHDYNYVNNPRTQVGAVVRAKYKDVKMSAAPSAFPIAEQLGDRRQQYLQRLINAAMADMTERPDDPAVDQLLSLIGNHVLHETGATSVELRGYLPADDYQAAKKLLVTEPSKRSVYTSQGDEARDYESPVTVEVQKVEGEFPVLARKSGKMQSSPAVPNKVPPSAPGGVTPLKNPESTDSPLKSTVPGLPTIEPKPN